MNFDYDVVIIGGGPAGSTIANYLSNEGLSICIVEKKKIVGYPLQCAGILSYHIFDFNELPNELILNEVKGAYIHTNNNTLKVERDETVAYIIDRIGYDEYLFSKALKNGVEFINQKAIDFNFEKGLVYLQNGKIIKSKIIVGCDGYSSSVSQKMGNIQENFFASQMLVRLNEESLSKFRNYSDASNNFVDASMFEDIIPGFLWIIPVGNYLYRAGLFSNHTHKKQSEILESYLDEHFEFEIVEKYKGFIPIFNEKNKLVDGRAILIGDAASQVKPTSGGGLLIAFDACRIAGESILKAIKKDDLNVLKNYQDEFYKKYQKEFNYQFKVQKTLNLLSDDDLDYLLLKLKENDGERLISEYGDMDNQSTLVKETIKRGLIFKILPTFLFKKISKIFGFRRL